MNRKFLFAIFSIFIFSILIHLKGISSPLLDFHSWRQTQTAMTARNYYENGFRFFYPQVDWEGENSSSRAGTEFPAFSFLTALLYKIFGLYDYLGRFLAVFFSALAAIYLFLLLLKYFDFWSSYISSLIFCVIPVNIYFTRTVQPESLMLFSTVAGIYYFINYLENTAGKKNLILSCIFLAVAPLVKLPSLYVVIPVLWLARRKFGNKIFKQPDLWIFFFLIFAGVYLWYNYAKSGIGVLPLSSGDFIKSLKIIGKSNFWSRQFLSRFVELTVTYAGLFFFAVGFRRVVIKNRMYLFAVWFFAVVLYTILIGEYGYVHQYTSLPYAPVNAAFIGFGIVYLWNKFKSSAVKKIFLAIFILTIPVHSFLRIRNWYKLSDAWLLNAQVAAGEISKPEDLFLCNSRPWPTQLYHIHRKGFSKDFSITDTEEIKKLVGRGVKFVLTSKDESWQKNSDTAYYFSKNYPVIYDAPEFKIFDLRKK